MAQPDEGIWFKFTAGDAEIFVLDTRSQRDPDLLPDPEEGPWEKSMLDGRHLGGNSQLKWLEEGLTTSTAKWKIIISTVTANIHARLSNLDHWMTGFEGEARKIRAIIEENGLKETTLMISADLHSGGAIDDGCNNGFGVTELGVPHTNLLKGNEDNIGVWNIGARDGTQNGGGYGMVKVDSEKLEIWAKGHDGETRVAHSLPYTGETGCFEERYPEPTSEEEQRGLEKCTRNIHQFPVPKPENPQCIGSPRNITLSPPFLNSVTGQYDLENEVEIYKCVETGVRIIKSNDIPDHGEFLRGKFYNITKTF